MQYSSEEAKKRKSRRVSLEDEVMNLELQLNNNPNDQSLLDKYGEAKMELEKLYDYISEGAIIRSKAK